MKIINFTKKWFCFIAMILIYIVYALQYIFIKFIIFDLLLWVCNYVIGNAFRVYECNENILTKATLKLAKISLPKELYEVVVEVFKKKVD
jgi:hypothetical protein